MPIKTTCPGCGTTCTAPDHLNGKTIQCKKCATPFAIGSQAQLHEAIEGSASPARPTAPLIPRPTGGIPLPRAKHRHWLKGEFLGLAILLAASGIFYLICVLFIKK